MADSSSVLRARQQGDGAAQEDDEEVVDPFWPDFNPRLLPGGLAWKGLLVLVILGLLAGLF